MRSMLRTSYAPPWRRTRKTWPARHVRRRDVRLLWPEVAFQGTHVLWGQGLRRHVGSLLGSGTQAADLQAPLRAHGAVRLVRTGLVVAGERRRGDAALRALRTSHGLAPRTLGVAAHVLLQRLPACLPQSATQGEEIRRA